MVGTLYLQTVEFCCPATDALSWGDKGGHRVSLRWPRFDRIHIHFVRALNPSRPDATQGTSVYHTPLETVKPFCRATARLCCYSLVFAQAQQTHAGPRRAGLFLFFAEADDLAAFDHRLDYQAQALE